MAGEYDDYKRNEDEIRRDKARRNGMWYRPTVPLWKKILKAAYWLSTPAFILATVVWFFVTSGIEAGFVALGGFLLVFVVIPLLCWLVQKWTGL